MGTRYFDQWKGYNFASFRKDLIAGFVVGIIAIPLGMAFAIAVGVKPEYGIYTTIIAGVLVSILGGSRFRSLVRQVLLSPSYLGSPCSMAMKTS